MIPSSHFLCGVFCDDLFFGFKNHEDGIKSITIDKSKTIKKNRKRYIWLKIKPTGDVISVPPPIKDAAIRVTKISTLEIEIKWAYLIFIFFNTEALKNVPTFKGK